MQRREILFSRRESRSRGSALWEIGSPVQLCLDEFHGTHPPPVARPDHDILSDEIAVTGETDFQPAILLAVNIDLGARGHHRRSHHLPLKINRQVHVGTETSDFHSSLARQFGEWSASRRGTHPADKANRENHRGDRRSTCHSEGKTNPAISLWQSRRNHLRSLRQRSCLARSARNLPPGALPPGSSHPELKSSRSAGNVSFPAGRGVRQKV